jgi:hypothetical protein
MTPIERAFLERLAGMKQGRCSYSVLMRGEAMEIAGGLIEGGYVKERDLGFSPGLQVTDKGREYLGGQTE